MPLHEIGKNFYHLRSDESVLHRNVYVKRFVGEGGKAATMVFDPGAKPDTPALTDALTEIAGDVRNVDFVFVSHQDPDVTSNVRFLVTNAPASLVFCSVDAWRLVKLVGVPDRRFYLIENWEPETFVVKATGHKVRAVPAHYCHFRGSMMLYDPESRVLFSGDLFGGINTRRTEGIYAAEASWEGIALFHQIYMPSQQALREAVARIRALEPAPAVIAPQHGDVIRGPFVAEFMERMEALDVGADLVRAEEVEKKLGLAALNSFFADLQAAAPEDYARLWASLRAPDDFTTPFRFADGRIADMDVSVRNAVVFITRAFDGAVRLNNRDEVMVMLALALETHGVPVPQYCLEDGGREPGAADESPLTLFLKDTEKNPKA